MKARLYVLLGILSIGSFGAVNGQLTTQNYISTRTMMDERGEKYLDVIQYFDGLGRPYLKLKKGITPKEKHLAILQQYDLYGRESNLWLPVKTETDLTDPVLVTNAASSQYNDLRPFNQTVYEHSPLNRIVEQYGSGNAWAANPVRVNYLVNTASVPLQCRNYTVSSSGTLTDGDNYVEGELCITESIDEDGHIIYTFTDKFQRVILTRQMNETVSHDTYNVYDDLGNLCFVLQPMYQENASLDLYAFQYAYDSRNRCIRKKIPGCQPVSFVYDKADNLIFSQDGVQKESSKWMFYLYDNLKRLVVQGISTNAPAVSDKVVTVSFSASDTGIGNSGYTSNINFNVASVLMVNYYDSYLFRVLQGFNNVNFPEGTVDAKGLLTGNVTSLLGGEAKMYSANYYNLKGLATKSVSSNHLGGYDIYDRTYTFTNMPLAVQHSHSATGQATLTENYTYKYDHANRLLSVGYKLGNNPVVTLSENVYDDLGRVQAKTLGATVHNTTYTYNIRDWLTGISGPMFTETLYYNAGMSNSPCYNGNLSSISWKAGTEAATRGFRLNYDRLNRLTVAQYGEGSSLSEYPERFTEKVTQYDMNGNMKHLVRSGLTGPSIYGIVDDLTIECIGNQLKNVNDAATSTAYGAGTNFINGSNSTGTQYVYDANGNLTQDLNKNISNIQYNALNLPLSIQFGAAGQVSYVYGTDGVKRKVTHKIGSATTTIDYCNNVIYEDGVFSKILTEEGYVTFTGSTPVYHYYLKDHQGNNRVVISESTVEQVNHYYPFGGLFGDGIATSNQPFKYNGKELDIANHLNWYDYGARMYDPVLGRWSTVDPMSDKRTSTTPYNYCQNNPINRVDPNGMLDDWFTQENGEIWFSPKVKSQSDLKIGERYLGRTYKEKDGTFYRSDGSILFTNETKAYQRMWSFANKNNREEGGFFLTNSKYGILYTPDYKNTNNEATPELYGYKLIAKEELIDPMGNKWNITGQIHTHQDKSLDATPSFTGEGNGDVGYSKKMGGLPIMTIGHDGYVHGAVYWLESGTFSKFTVSSRTDFLKGKIRLMQWLKLKSYKDEK